MRGTRACTLSLVAARMTAVAMERVQLAVRSNEHVGVSLGWTIVELCERVCE